MSDYFDCKVCDKSIRIKSRKKHLNSINHKSLKMSIIFRYSVTGPDFLHIENLIKNYILEYKKNIYFI